MDSAGEILLSKIIVGTATENDFYAVTLSARHIVAFLNSNIDIIKSFGMWCRIGISKKTCAMGFFDGVTEGYKVRLGGATGKGYFRYHVSRVKA